MSDEFATPHSACRENVRCKMLSNDKNVEAIAQLVENVKNYLGLQKEYLKIDIFDKCVRLLTALALFIVFFLIIIFAFMYCSFAVAYWLAGYVGDVAAFFIVAFFHLIVLVLFIAYSKALIQRPIIRFLTNLFMS